MNEFELAEQRAALDLLRVAKAHVNSYAQPEDREAALEALLHVVYFFMKGKL